MTTIAEAERSTGLSRGELMKFINSGRLLSFRTGRRYRLFESDLALLMQSLREESKQECHVFIYLLHNLWYPPVMVQPIKTPTSLIEAASRFADPEFAFAYLVAQRWPGKVACPRCGTIDPHFIKSRKLWRCAGCKQQFSVRTGTILEDSPIPVGKWLIAIWVMANSKNGVSSCELARTLGITQKSAWHLVHRIRLAMEAKPPFRRFSGQVECDESLLGGKYDKRRKSHQQFKGRGTGHLTPVFGLIERESGTVRALVIPDVKGPTVRDAVYRNVWPGSELFTDNYNPYWKLRRDFIHKAVSHSTGEYVRDGYIHTNQIEGFWNLMKRCARGTWVRPSPKHWGRYVADQAYRYNVRQLDDAGRFDVLTTRLAGRLTWRELVDGDQG